MHATLQQILHRLSLPPAAPLQSSPQEPHSPSHEDFTPHKEEQEQSCDDSPRLPPMSEALANVPIDSLYQITGLKSLRTEAANGEENRSQDYTPMEPDFISQGLLSVDDAQRLLHIYLTRLDPYIYHLASGITDLNSLRLKSNVLTACICTVASLHDPTNPHLYQICSREFRRLVSSSMFDRRIDFEYLRALCIGSYWLSDISWVLSGYAIRRGSELQLNQYYYQAAVIQSPIAGGASAASASTPDAQECLDRTRVLYLLYILDQHLSILYGRGATIREQDYVQETDAFLASPFTNENDQRMISQVALLLIMSRVRDLFGPDRGEVVPRAFLPQLNNFNRQLDQWLGRWSVSLRPSTLIGDFPAKGVLMHYHFAKLHLCSCVFRGLGEQTPVPPYFVDVAMAAVQAATTIIELILEDRDVRMSLNGVPHYIHTMAAFACVFLLKLARRRTGQFLVAEDVVFTLTSKIASLFRATPTSRWHLIHRMADGIDKMRVAISKRGDEEAAYGRGSQSMVNGTQHIVNDPYPPSHFFSQPHQGAPEPPRMGMPMNGAPPSFEMDGDLGMGMPFLDLEGNTFDPDNSGFGFL